VFVSSHLMSEMALTADHLIVIGRGRLIRDEGVNEFIESSSQHYVRIRSPRLDLLVPLLQQAGAQAQGAPEGAVDIAKLEAATIGEIAAANGVVLHELAPIRPSLEEAFMELTRDSVEYRSGEVAR
jgi:ABC-2 type transport system ATP-binding protein